MRISKQIIVVSLFMMVGLLVACAPLVRPAVEPAAIGQATPQPAGPVAEGSVI